MVEKVGPRLRGSRDTGSRNLGPAFSTISVVFPPSFPGIYLTNEEHEFLGLLSSIVPDPLERLRVVGVL